MKYTSIILITFFALFVSACSNGPKPLETVVKGNITLSDSLQQDGDFSGTKLTIVSRDSANSVLDTLFQEVTDESGFFSGTVHFPEKKYYQMILNRDSVNLGNFGVILAEGDTLNISAQIPDIQQTLQLDSGEHNSMKTYLRVDRNFQRIGLIAQRGVMSDSQMVSEIKKWTEFYWDVYEKYPNTIGANLSAEKSIHLMSTWNANEMLNRIDMALPNDFIMNVALNYAHPYISEVKGFDAGSNYLDSLKNITQSGQMKEIIDRVKIQFYFDSSRVREAKDLLTNYEQAFDKNSSSKKWARRIRYDLNYLAPGVQAPDFSFITMNGDTVNNESLKGTVYILEISPLANRMYQDDYDRTVIIHEIYKNYGLKIFTIPLDASELTVEGFFEERRQVWDIAKIGSFNVPDVIQKFNVVQVPTRLLIDENGVLIRKYERGEFEDVIQGLNEAFRSQNSPS
ncbi:peroxiredoxin family protein [Gracilimonas tropica]|uniref:peroxiredoxin family protein n=1 Tax=Gracilimonas tropica TaxID=454600 RepID=UPI00036C24FF|nr:hypothetical protein [Gracilimonas tropica]